MRARGLGRLLLPFLVSRGAPRLLLPFLVSRGAPRLLLPSLVSRGALRLLLPCLLVATAVRADVPDPPVFGVDHTSSFVYVGDPLLGLDAGDLGLLFQRFPDVLSHEASVTKSWALHVTVEAIHDGFVDWDDLVPISAWAGRPHMAAHTSVDIDPATMADPELFVGEQYRLEDLMHLIFITSDGAATLAMAEHVARAKVPVLDTFPLNLIPFLPRDVFVAEMNDRAEALGLVDTSFTTPYGAGHGHQLGFPGNDDGTDAPHFTTPREIAKWFAFAMSDADYRELMGFRGTYAFSNAAGTRNFSLGFNPGYPGLVGRKPGGNENCTTCLTSLANRIGRDVVMGFMQSASGSTTDEQTFFDYAFARLFVPEDRGESPSVGSYVDHSLACVAPHRSASSVVTNTGNLRVILWRTNLGARQISEVGGGSDPCDEEAQAARAGGLGPPVPPGAIGAVASAGAPGRQRLAGPGARGAGPIGARGRRGRRDDPPDDREERFARLEPLRQLRALISEIREVRRSDDFAVPPPGPDPPGSDLPGDVVLPGPDCDDPPGTIVGKLAVASHLAHAGQGNLVVGLETTQGLEIQVWGIPVNGPAFLRDGLLAGAGSNIRVQVLDEAGLFATADRTSDGFLRIRTWRLDLATGQLDPGPLATLTTTTFTDEHEVAGREHVFLTAHLVVHLQVAQSQRLLAFSIDPGSGNILPGGNVSVASSARLPAVARVEGWTVFDDVYATAYRAASGNLAVRAWSMALDGSVTSLGPAVDTGYPVSLDGALEIADYDQRGVLVGVKDDQDDVFSTYASFALDGDPASGSLTPGFIVDRTSGPNAGLLGLCRVPDDEAEGDFLVAQANFFDGQLELRGWRSAPRSACGLLGIEVLVVLGLARARARWAGAGRGLAQR